MTGVRQSLSSLNATRLTAQLARTEGCDAGAYRVAGAAGRHRRRDESCAATGWRPAGSVDVVMTSVRILVDRAHRPVRCSASAATAAARAARAPPVTTVGSMLTAIVRCPDEVTSNGTW